MSSNTKINEISQNVFSEAATVLVNKTPREIQEKKDEFEYQLEIMISNLKKSERDELLSRLKKDSEQKKVSIFDSNGNISIDKIKKIVTTKLKELAQEKDNKENIESRKTNTNTTESKEARIDFSATEEEKKAVELKLSIYERLKTAKDRQAFICDEFELDRNTKPEEIENYEELLDIAVILKKAREQGASREELQKIIDRKQNLKRFDRSLITVDKNGFLPIEVVMQINSRIRGLRETQRGLKDKRQKSQIDDEIDRLNQKKQDLLPNFLKIPKKTYKFEELSHSNEDVIDSEKAFVSFNEDVNAQKIDLKRPEPLKEMKKIEDLSSIVSSKQNLSDAIHLFTAALTYVEMGASREQFQEMINELQEDTSPEVVEILEVLPNMEFDRDLDEILSSDEYIMELVEQLSEFSENLQEKEVESQQQDQTPIADQEFKSSGQVTFEEMVVGEQPDRSQESDKNEGETHLEQSDTERKESVTVFMPLTSIMKSTAGVRTSNIRDEKNMLAKLTQENVLIMEGNSI